MSESRSWPTRADPAAVEPVSDWQPNIAAMVCRWCTYAGADLAGTSRLNYPAAVRIVRFPCTGRMSPLFVMRAFEQGADGVLVSGCHPGDCHYVRGNLYARRRFAVLKSLVEFLGIDARRLHFSWVSASEGNKWVSVVQRVTEAVRAAGPASRPGASEPVEIPEAGPSGRARAAAGRREAQTSRLARLAADLLAQGKASAVLGYRRGSLPGRVDPALVRRAEETEGLVWDERCYANLAVYLPRLRRTEERVAVVVKPCDAATVVALLQEKQFAREQVLLVGMQCGGVWLGDRLADKCRSCDGQVPALCDVAITPEGERELAGAVEADPRDAAIDYLDQLPGEARREFWREEFARCIRCYACRAACPLCYCDTCIADQHRPQWISPAIDESGNAAWNTIRAFHLAGRCTGCDECARVCPADIRLDLINRKLARVVQQRFGYRAGTDLAAAPPLTDFRDDDEEEFIL